LKSRIFVTVGKRSVAYDKYAHKTLPERQDKIIKVLPFRQMLVAISSSAGNASLAYGYENQAFQAYSDNNFKVIRIFIPKT
jgi:hypothetical protein